MLYLIIIIVSTILAFLLRTFDILLAFRDRNISVSLIDSFKTLLLLSKNQIFLCFDLLKNKNWKELKKYLYSYIFNFDVLITLLVSILYEVNLATETNHVPILKMNKNESFMDKIKNIVPTYNDRQVNLAI